MQPEPAKYSHAPNMEATSFMQPEQPYYAHHPGRFFYVKDEQSKALFSAPYEPVRSNFDKFKFIVEHHKLSWVVEKNDVRLEICLSLCKDHPAELWTVKLINLSSNEKKLSLTPYFPVGYMSWMNQSARYDKNLQAIICHSVTPYQKYQDYFKNKEFKDLTYLLSDIKPSSWESRQSAFEGEGGLHSPSYLDNENLSNSEADYETPTAAFQFKVRLASKESKTFKLVYGPAKDISEIKKVKDKLLTHDNGFDLAIDDYGNYIDEAKSPIKISTPDKSFDNFVNHWLSRQIYYHGDVNRLCTDPQTRNYLQDTMGLSYINPNTARKAFIHAVKQQQISGAMPDGILLHEGAKLKYINQVPHMDHCVWLPICLQAYLDETADYSILDEKIPYIDSETVEPLSEHIDRALQWLFDQRNQQGLNYIKQGDWCDPMNMVGHKGRGVSIWLTLANAYANNTWAEICKEHGRQGMEIVFLNQAKICNDSVNQYGWDGKWYARGITDDGLSFGTQKDEEGKIFLNPQSWAILSGASNSEKQSSCINAVEEHLETQYGVEMLSPAFSKMREDIGRVTQKHPGTAENGSIYNHASAFYVYALYKTNQNDRAYRLLSQMIPGENEDDLLQRGQLPTFIPNYYRGAVKNFPRTAGRSSQLFNTGTVHWFYRCLIDGLFGIKGCKNGLTINPQIPSHWQEASIERIFRKAKFIIAIKRKQGINKMLIDVNGIKIDNNIIKNIQAESTYHVQIIIP